MDSSQIVMIFTFIVLISLSALFSMSETAFMSINKIRVKTLAEENNRKAILIRSLLEDQTRLLSSILVGNLVNIAASSLTTSFVISILGNEGTGVALATGVVTLIILIFGEITPKSLATQNAESIAFGVCRFIKFIVIIFTPVVAILNIVSGFFVRLFGGDANKGPTMTEEDLKTIVTVSHEEGVLEDEEKEMFSLQKEILNQLGIERG